LVATQIHYRTINSAATRNKGIYYESLDTPTIKVYGGLQCRWHRWCSSVQVSARLQLGTIRNCPLIVAFVSKLFSSCRKRTRKNVHAGESANGATNALTHGNAISDYTVRSDMGQEPTKIAGPAIVCVGPGDDPTHPAPIRRLGEPALPGALSAERATSFALKRATLPPQRGPEPRRASAGLARGSRSCSSL